MKYSSARPASTLEGLHRGWPVHEHRRPFRQRPPGDGRCHPVGMRGRCAHGAHTAGADGYYDAVFAYDTITRTMRPTDALGRTGAYRMNEAGWLVEETGPLGNSRRYSWSRYDDLRSQVDDLGRVTCYRSPSCRLLLRCCARTALADPLGDEPVTTAAVRPGDPDMFGRPRLVHTAPGGGVRLGWTANGRRAWRVGPHGDREIWLHDAEGRAVEHRDAMEERRSRPMGRSGCLSRTSTHPARARSPACSASSEFSPSPCRSSPRSGGAGGRTPRGRSPVPCAAPGIAPATRRGRHRSRPGR